MTRGGQSVSTGIATLGDGRDAPVVMLADGPASGTGHLKPTKPDQSGFGSGVGLKPDPKEVIVIPMPAAAGMALAGLFLIGSTRRR